MLRPDQSLALYMEGALGDPHGKMAYGILRFSPNPVACVIDSTRAGGRVQDVVDCPRDCPVVASVAEAVALGAEVLVLGIAPSGGRLPPEWLAALDEAVASGLSIVNGLFDYLEPRYAGRLRRGQWVWDVRREPTDGLGVGKGRACELRNLRVLTVGTDMACGKMTAALLLAQGAERRGWPAAFLATGQIGIVISGGGLPLDAVRVDYASGAMERRVLEKRDAELLVVEGQGSVLHPGSTATLPLLRGVMPTHLLLCHRAGQQTLRDFPHLRIPPLSKVMQLYRDLASACGLYPAPQALGICLNTGHLTEREARKQIAVVEEETGLPATDPLRFGVDVLLDGLNAGGA